MAKEIEISVVIPIYGNESSLIELTYRLIDHLSDFSFEIIYINDLSRDKSLEKLKVLSSQNEEFHVLFLFFYQALLT